MDRPLKIRIRSSRIAIYYCLLVTVLSFVAIGLTGLPLLLCLLLGGWAAVMGWRAVRAVRVPWVTGLECRAGDWFLCAGDFCCPVKFGQKIFLGLGIISVRLELETRKKIYLVLWPDSADEDSLRRLRIKLLAMEKS